MIIRRNTKAFKTISEIVTACEERADRAKLIRLYITRAGHSIGDRISVEGIEEETDVFYDLTFAAVVANLSSANHQLHVSDEVPGIYFFHSTTNKVWDENPFEFDERVVKEFGSLPELPVTRKKEKPIKPPPQTKRVVKPEKKEKASGETKKTIGKKERTGVKKETVKPQKQSVKQPAYKLKKKIQFTNLDDVIFKRSGATKRDLLDYYHAIADYILPFLKDRPQLIRIRAGRSKTEEYRYREALVQGVVGEVPTWIPSAPATGGKLKQEVLLCNTKEQLLYYVEQGCVDFYGETATLKSHGRPDLCVIRIESGDDSFGKVVDVAQMANYILNALQLPSFVMSDGASVLHVYIPLDAKSDFDVSRELAEFICKLIVLKMPEQVVLKGSDDQTYRKVTLDCSLNGEQEVVIAPYSLTTDSETVAVPLFWEEVTKGLRMERFKADAVLERLKDTGDPFAGIFNKQVNARKVAGELEKRYSFLF